MRETVMIRALEMHDANINKLCAELQTMRTVLDKSYLHSLTHVMMWDVLLGLLNEKGMVTKDQFDQALKELSEKTKASMEDEAKKKAEPQGVSQ